MALSRPLRKPAADSLTVASVAARLAVFMTAGLSPKRSWEELGDGELHTHTDNLIGQVNDLVRDGLLVHDALADVTGSEDEAWRVLAAVHSVAHDTGSPLGEALWALSDALQERHEAERAVHAAVLVPLYTQRLLMGLPVLGLLISLALGVDTIGFLTGHPLGWISLGLAIVLMMVAGRWTKNMVRRSLPQPGYLSPALDLLAIATSGGALPDTARHRVVDALTKHDLVHPPGAALEKLPELSRRVGVPLRALARAEASWTRARAKADAADSAAALSVKILIPLGALVLPAFILVAVIPVVFALLEGALAPGGVGLW